MRLDSGTVRTEAVQLQMSSLFSINCPRIVMNGWDDVKEMLPTFECSVGWWRLLPPTPAHSAVWWCRGTMVVDSTELPCRDSWP